MMLELSLDKSKKYLLACSFGPDSMALFHLLLVNGYKFEVAHVNYHLRKESDTEENGLKDYCSKNNIIIHCYNNTNPITKNVEEECRTIRYSFFASLFYKNNYDALLVAHNQDDLLETYLLQKKRGNLPLFYGLKQISNYQNMVISRPLLDYKKSELLEYVEENNVPYAIDKSNLENTFERNIIRHNIVEIMADQDRKTMLEQIDGDNASLNKLFIRISNVDATKINEVVQLDDNEFAYCLTTYIRTVVPDYELSLKHAREIKKKLLSTKPNIIIPLNDSYSLVKEYEKISLVNNKPIKYSYTLNEPCVFDCNYFYLNFTSKDVHRGISQCDYPITITNQYEGKCYKVKNYNKEIRRLFIDWKMPLSLRRYWPIILSKDGRVLFVPRYRSDYVTPKDADFYVKIQKY